MQSIPLVNLKRQHQALLDEIREAIDQVITRGDFVLGSELAAFEEEFAAYCGVKYCIGVGNGLDALTLALKGLGVGQGDEVITTANTFIATAMAIHLSGATPVLVDHDPQTYNLDPRRIAAAITPRSKAILPVHLYGQPADMAEIQAFADEHGLMVVEDACQAHGARYHGRRCGSLGRVAAFSFYPGKNLGAMGDGGAIVTNDEELTTRLRAMRNCGSIVKYLHPLKGCNTRLDCMQAAILRIKLRYLDQWNARRRQLAARYRERLETARIILPIERNNVEHIYHIFAVRCSNRDEILAQLNKQGIGAGVHYPVPIHHQPAFQTGAVVAGPMTYSERSAKELLSLPMDPYLSDEEADRVADELIALTTGAPAPATVLHTAG